VAVIAAIAAIASSLVVADAPALDAGDAGAVVAAACRGMAGQAGRALDTYPGHRGPRPDAARQPARADRLGVKRFARRPATTEQG
jgi:hypothetical protein